VDQRADAAGGEVVQQHGHRRGKWKVFALIRERRSAH
jgi:hypothetical protein